MRMTVEALNTRYVVIWDNIKLLQTDYFMNGLGWKEFEIWFYLLNDKHKINEL